MKIKKFVRRHRTAIFTASMIGTGIIIGMHIKKNDCYSDFLDLADKMFTKIGVSTNEEDRLVGICLGNKNESDYLAFPLKVDKAKDFANDILNACKEIENETQKEA